MPTLHLTTFQRISLTSALSSVEGNAQVMRKAIKLLDIIELNQEERQRIGFEVIETPNGIGAGWRDISCEWDIEIGDDNLYALLKQRVAAYVWPQGTLSQNGQRKEMIALLDMLGID